MHATPSIYCYHTRFVYFGTYPVDNEICKNILYACSRATTPERPPQSPPCPPMNPPPPSFVAGQMLCGDRSPLSPTGRGRRSQLPFPAMVRRGLDIQHVVMAAGGGGGMDVRSHLSPDGPGRTRFLTQLLPWRLCRRRVVG
jgi:hypothetical protein